MLLYFPELYLHFCNPASKSYDFFLKRAPLLNKSCVPNKRNFDKHAFLECITELPRKTVYIYPTFRIPNLRIPPLRSTARQHLTLTQPEPKFGKPHKRALAWRIYGLVHYVFKYLNLWLRSFLLLLFVFNSI